VPITQTIEILPVNAPPDHYFSMVIDWAADTATTGEDGEAQEIPLERGNAVWSAQKPIRFALGEDDSLCYTELQLRPVAGGCTGESSGVYEYATVTKLT
jgi:hypothetical protein